MHKRARSLNFSDTRDDKKQRTASLRYQAIDDQLQGMPRDLVDLIFEYQHPSRLVQLVEQYLKPLGPECRDIGRPELLPHALRDIFVHYADTPEQEADGAFTEKLCMSRTAVRNYMQCNIHPSRVNSLETFVSDTLDRLGSRSCMFNGPDYLTYSGFTDFYTIMLGWQLVGDPPVNLFITDLSEQAVLLTR
jgi:hypothetical protein